MTVAMQKLTLNQVDSCVEACMMIKLSGNRQHPVPEKEAVWQSVAIV